MSAVNIKGEVVVEEDGMRDLEDERFNGGWWKGRREIENRSREGEKEWLGSHYSP